MALTNSNEASHNDRVEALLQFDEFLGLPTLNLQALVISHIVRCAWPRQRDPLARQCGSFISQLLSLNLKH